MVPDPFLGMNDVPLAAMQQVIRTFSDAQHESAKDLLKVLPNVFSNGKPSRVMLDHVQSHLDVITSYDYKLRTKADIPLEHIETNFRSIAYLSHLGGNVVLAAIRELAAYDFAQQVFRDQSRFERLKEPLRPFKGAVTDDELHLLLDVLAVDIAVQRKRKVTQDQMARRLQCEGALNHVTGGYVLGLFRVLASRPDLWHPLFEIQPGDQVTVAQPAEA